MSEWISVSERLPELEETVWLCEGDKMWIGGRFDDSDGWLWANGYGSHWWNGDQWECDGETDDDYKPTHWMPLPLPPAQTTGAVPEPTYAPLPPFCTLWSFFAQEHNLHLTDTELHDIIDAVQRMLKEQGRAVPAEEDLTP